MPDPRTRIAIAGLNHGHVSWIMGNLNHHDVEVAAIYEPDRELVERFSDRFHFPMRIVFSDLNEMLASAQPSAVAAFNPIAEHLKVVEACAPLKIHVMVEKPLAVNMEQAARMADLVRQYGIHLLTNFETSWYASTYAAYEKVVIKKEVGDIRKIVVRDGHQGPQEIGVGPEFLTWLTDPVLNGGGAIVDFGCYGAGLIPWLMQGELPQSVTAVAQTLKPDVYPKVDDEANIILAYPHAVGIIEGSWNWPIGRKDMEIYGQSGSVLAPDATHLVIQKRGEGRGKVTTKNETLEKLTDPRADPFSYLAGVVSGKITVEPGSLYSLENNLKVVRILDAARESALTGRTVKL